LCYFSRIIGNYINEPTRAKEEEKIMHKVGIRLGKRSIVEEEQSNVDGKPAEKPPTVDAVAPVVVGVPRKIDYRIEFTTDREFEQRSDMLTWVRDLS
jgi:hypothetical protein